MFLSILGKVTRKLKYSLFKYESPKKSKSDYDPYSSLDVPSIALVTTWIGPWPFWMSAFLLSCQHNPTVDWIIFTDNEAPPDSPANVYFRFIDITTFCNLASHKLGFRCELSPDYAYKLCDYKVAYGHIYEDFLKSYDFWGHCDLDIVWGSIRSFMTPELLWANDIISSRVRRLSGHFTIYRNTRANNRLYRLIPGFRSLLSIVNQSMFIDEELFSNVIDQLAPYPWTPWHFKLPIPNLPYACIAWSKWYAYWQKSSIAVPINGWNLRMLLPKHSLRVIWSRDLASDGLMQRSLKVNQFFYWLNGRTYGPCGNELMYIHFHILKKNTSFRTFFDEEDIPTKFTIDHRGFAAYKMQSENSLPLIN